MHFEPSAVPAEIVPLVRRLVSITTWDRWAKRLENFKKRVAVDPLLDEYLSQRYPIELAMAHLHARIARGQKIDLPTTPAEAALLAFAAMIARVHPRLSEPGRVRLSGMLRSGLDDDAGLAPLAHEMGIAAHLMGRGFDVTFSDMEVGGGFDFLAERDGAALEIECKTVSGDLGRKIHLRRLYQLGNHLYPLMSAAADRRSGGQLARIVLPGRLYGTDQQLQAIRESLRESLSSGKSVAGPEPCAIDYREFSLTGSPFQTMPPSSIERERARQYIEATVGFPIGNAVTLFSPRHAGVVMVAVESRKNNAVVKGLVQQLKESVKKQLSGTRPAVVCVKFLDITQADLLDIVEQDKSDEPSALKLATSYLLGREDWATVHTLAYLTPVNPTASRRFDGQTVTRSVQERGHTYTFANPNCTLAADRRFSIF